MSLAIVPTYHRLTDTCKIVIDSANAELKEKALKKNLFQFCALYLSEMGHGISHAYLKSVKLV